MDDVVDEASAINEGLAALQFWLFDFHQLEACSQDFDVDAPLEECNLARFDNVDTVTKIIDIAEEICDCEISSRRPASASQAWAAIHSVACENGLSIEHFDEASFESRECQYKVLSALLCHALSDRCTKQRDYIERIKEIGRPDVQQEIMRILQESVQCNDVEDNNETGDYSVFMEASVASISSSFDYASDTDTKRDRSAAFGVDSPQEKKRHHAGVGDESFEEADVKPSTRGHQSENEDALRATITKLEQELKESRQQELDLTLKADEVQSQHRAEMLQVESKYLNTIRDQEERYTNEMSEQKKELEMLRDNEQSAKALKEENSRLRDELDVLECSKEKLAFTEEQLRKCREKIELIGDAHDALQREEKAHAASVDKCLQLESELAQMKPLKRQVEEYRVRATDAEVALAECREDLRRVKEKSSGLEGANRALKRGAHLQQAEAGNLQKRLLEESSKSGKGGTAVGVGMSELNPELMEELKMLRSEYTRLKEFESKREVDSVQRLEESCDDATRLAERFKEQFLQTKSELEDTQQLLNESEAREAKLNEEVRVWAKKYKGLEEEMKEERLKSHRAALDAERSYQNEKKSLIEKGREELKDLEEKLTLKIEAERKQHRNKMDRAEAQRVDIEKNLTEQLTLLREQSSKTLRSTKDQHEKMMSEAEQSKKTEVDKVLKERAEKIEELKTKGKEMLRKERQKTENLKRKIKEEYDVKIRSLEGDLEQVKSFQLGYEEKATAKIAKRDQQIKLLEARNAESIRLNSDLEEKAKKAERNSKQIAGDNERLRRQLASRFGPGGASEQQLKDLTSMCKSLREENRRLKEANPDRLLLAKGDVPASSSGEQQQEITSFNKDTLSEFREEYEEQIEALKEEKRDLVMKNSASTTDIRKAEQRAWELEEELTKVKSELTTAKLALQRNERRNDFKAGLSSSSKKHYEAHVRHEKENTPNAQRGLPPSGVKRQDFAPKEYEPAQKKQKAAPSVMDHLIPKSDSDEAGAGLEQTPECQQS